MVLRSANAGRFTPNHRECEQTQAHAEQRQGPGLGHRRRRRAQVDEGHVARERTLVQVIGGRLGVAVTAHVGRARHLEMTGLRISLSSAAIDAAGATTVIDRE